MFRQMEKLIELLKDQYWEVVTYNIQSDWGYMFHISWFAVREERLLSKKFWFIKWLVENEKIDVEKVYNNSDYPMVKREEFLYEWLLMLLSIQDEPIEFLISILKNV